MTKEELFESALALNGDDKKYEITVEDNRIITRVKWMDAVLFSPTSITDKEREFTFIIKINDDGTYIEEEKHVSTQKSAGLGGLRFNKRTTVGPSARVHRSIAIGIDKETKKLDVLDHSFNSEEYKAPVRALMKRSGYKKKMSPIVKNALIIASVLIAASIACVAIVISMDSAKNPIGTDDFEAAAKASGYLVEAKEDNGDVTLTATDEQDGYKIKFYTLSDADEAKRSFRSKRSVLEKAVEASTTDSNTSSSSGAKSEKYKASASGKYMYVIRIENTVLLVNVGASHKEEVQNFVDEIGY